MKFYLSTTFSLLAIANIFCTDKPSTPTKTAPFISYVGTLQLQDITEFQLLKTGKESHTSPSVPVYYKGSTVTLENGSFILTEQENHTDFVIIVALLQQPSTNTIESFTVPHNTPYALYRLKKIQNQPTTEDWSSNPYSTWNIQKEEGLGIFTVPKNALVVLTDPSCIQAVTANPWPAKNTVIPLPRIAFKKDFEKSDAYNRSLLASLDVAPFHKKDTLISTAQSNKSISTLRK